MDKWMVIFLFKLYIFVWIQYVCFSNIKSAVDSSSILVSISLWNPFFYNAGCQGVQVEEIWSLDQETFANLK